MGNLDNNALFTSDGLELGGVTKALSLRIVLWTLKFKLPPTDTQKKKAETKPPSQPSYEIECMLWLRLEYSPVIESL